MNIFETFYYWAIENGKTGARLFATGMFLMSPYLLIRAIWEEMGGDIKDFYKDCWEAAKSGVLPR